MMKPFNKLINFFNLSLGIGLLFVVTISIARIYLVGVDALSIANLSDQWRRRVASQDSTPPSDNHDSALGTAIYGPVGLTSEQMENVAKNIYRISEGMDDTYAVADGLTLSMYILRNMAEIGEYDLAQKDIFTLVGAFENLGGMKLNAQIIDILTQIKKIRFGRKSGKLFAQIYSTHPKRGVDIAINEISDDPNSSLKEVLKIVIKDGATLSFQDVTKTKQINHAVDFIKTPVKILGAFESLVSELNQFQKGVSDEVDHYFMRDDLLASALWIGIENIYVAVDTSTIFKHIKFSLKHALALPGMSNKEGRLSSFFIGAKAKLLNLKASIDQ